MINRIIFILVISILFVNCSNIVDLKPIKINDKWGYKDSSEKIVIEPKFEDVKEFSEGLAAVKINDKWGFIDKNGDFKLKPQFDSASSFKSGYVEIRIDTKWKKIDKDGKEAFRIPLGKAIESFLDFMYPISKSTKSFSDKFERAFDNLVSLLSSIPPWIIIIIFTFIGWRLASIKIGVFVLLGLLLVWNMDLWQDAISTITLVIMATLIAIILGIPLGIISGLNNTFNRIITPILDFMQTMPAFVYLIPAIPFFGLGPAAGIFSTVIFSIPPVIRLTFLGIRQVPKELIEAADAFGSTKMQKLIKVQLPVASTTIMAGINQTIMLALSMVVIAGMIGAGGLGSKVWSAIQVLDMGSGFESGFAVVIIAMILDRISQNIAKGNQKTTKHQHKTNKFVLFIKNFFKKEKINNVKI